MNKADSVHLANSLQSLGYRSATDIKEADLIVLNSCVVRQKAEDRVISKIRALRELKEEHYAFIIQ